MTGRKSDYVLVPSEESAELLATVAIRSRDIDPVSGKHYYEICDACNYDRHACYFCGESLSHNGVDPGGNLHDTAYCRPDLVEHEPGELCTWPDDPERNKYRQPGCYWDHEKGCLTE